MNDDTFAQLEDVVNEALRPVWASRSRKQMLRMELLAHVMDVFQAELATCGEERTAVNQTLCRFGLAEAIGCELQESLGFSDRWLCISNKETFMSRWLWVLAIVSIFVGPAFIMPAVALYRDAGVLQLFPLILGAIITLSGFAITGYGIRQRIAHS